jgi:hypothetical protein
MTRKELVIAVITRCIKHDDSDPDVIIARLAKDIGKANLISFMTMPIRDIVQTLGELTIQEAYEIYKKSKGEA